MVGSGSSPSKSPALKLSPTTYQTTPFRLLLLLLTTGNSLEQLSAELLDSTSSLELLDSAELLEFADSLKLLDTIGSLELLYSIELQDISTEDERPKSNASLLEYKKSAEEELSPHDTKQKENINNAAIAFSLIYFFSLPNNSDGFCLT